MAWIESHQGLRTNPKAKRLARILDVPLPQVIGHLHMLWWWALDHAFDGDLSKFDAFDVADAAGWDADAEEFVTALIDCGPRGRSGFIDGEPDDQSTWRLHDWHEFTDAMRSKREASEKAHHTRWHEKRGVRAPDCRFCDATAQRPHSDRTTDALPAQSDRTGSADAPTRVSNAQTGTDLPEPNPPAPARDDPDSPEDDDLGDEGGKIIDHPQATAHWQAAVGKLPARLRRRINHEPTRHVDRLRRAVANAAEAGLRPGQLKALWDQPTSLDAPGVGTVAGTFADRIEKAIVAQEQHA